MPPDPYNQERVNKLTDPGAFRYCSGEELRSLLAPDPDWQIADFGSGPGLFTSELAPVVDTVFAIDLRMEFFRLYRDRGMPPNVLPITADFERLPFRTNSLDGGVSVRTFHHGFDDTLDEIARIFRSGGRLVVVDWSATGAGERDTLTDETYFDLATAQSRLIEHDFRIRMAQERRETFVVVAERR